MTDLITALPNGLVPPMKEIEGTELPEVRIEMPEIVIPVLVRKETREIYIQDGENEYAGEVDVYRYFEVRTAFDGGDITDYAGICSAYWKPLREAFYGSQEFQADLDYDHRKTAHILAVKDAFRKPGQATPPDGIARWTAVKEAFWQTIRSALKLMDMDESELPAYFNAEYMLELAQGKLSTAQIATFSSQLQMISFDMLHNGRNWSELFRNE